jgi:hypothetical protein
MRISDRAFKEVPQGSGGFIYLIPAIKPWEILI